MPSSANKSTPGQTWGEKYSSS